MIFQSWNCQAQNIIGARQNHALDSLARHQVQHWQNSEDRLSLINPGIVSSRHCIVPWHQENTCYAQWTGVSQMSGMNTAWEDWDGLSWHFFWEPEVNNLVCPSTTRKSSSKPELGDGPNCPFRSSSKYEVSEKGLKPCWDFTLSCYCSNWNSTLSRRTTLISLFSLY